MSAAESQLIRFLRGDASAHPCNSRIYTPEWIIHKSTDMWLEGTHDYIQWCFPTFRKSDYNPEAPVLTPGDLETILGDPALQTTIRDLLERMLQFYQDTDHWRRRLDHNHARISRILTTVKLVFGAAEARRTYERIVSYEITGRERWTTKWLITTHTRRIWQAIIQD